MNFKQGDVIRYSYTHSNGNQYWKTWKEGLFVKDVDGTYCKVLLLGNSTISKVKYSDIEKKDDIDITDEMKLFEDKNRVNDSQIFSWKQVKKILSEIRCVKPKQGVKDEK